MYFPNSQRCTTADVPIRVLKLIVQVPIEQTRIRAVVQIATSRFLTPNIFNCKKVLIFYYISKKYKGENPPYQPPTSILRDKRPAMNQPACPSPLPKYQKNKPAIEPLYKPPPAKVVLTPGFC